MCLPGRSAPPLPQPGRNWSTNAPPAAADRVHDFLPWYSSVHRVLAQVPRSHRRRPTTRVAALSFAGRSEDGDDVAIICRNTTEAINHLADPLQLKPADVS